MCLLPFKIGLHFQCIVSKMELKISSSNLVFSREVAEPGS